MAGLVLRRDSLTRAVGVGVDAFRQNGRKASLAISAQGIQGLASLILQVLAARALGPSGYGQYALILGVLVTLSAAQAGLRDSAIVLEHHDDSLHGSVVTSQYVALVVATVVAFVAGDASGLSRSNAGLFALAVGLWILEEAGRRFFMSDQRFGALVINDLFYAAGSLGTVAAIWLTTGELQLSSFLWALSAGAAVSFGAAIFQLAKGTFRVGGTSLAGLRQVFRFASWRSAQMVVRPLSLTLTRAAVIGVASTATLGQIEAARLLISPIQVVVNGFGPFLLTQLVRQVPKDRAGVTRTLGPPTVFLVGIATVGGLIAVLGADWLQPLLVNDKFGVNQLAIAGWALLVVVSTAGFPPATLAVAQQEPYTLFSIRVLDAGIGLAAVVAMASFFNPQMAAPYGLTIGATVGTVLLWRRSYLSVAPGAAHMTRGKPTASPA